MLHATYDVNELCALSQQNLPSREQNKQIVYLFTWS